MKNISILGSTGSIGTQALDVIRHNKDKYKVAALSANRNIDLLYRQIIEFEPYAVAVPDYLSGQSLREMLGNNKTEIYIGMEGLVNIAELNESDMVLVSVVGMVGLMPTIKAIEKGKKIALANKETLVSGGIVVKKALEKSNSEIIPVDSEHSAIFQCMQGSKRKEEAERILLTASGGPFRGRTYDELKNVRPEDALKHPSWRMGKKITVDCATLMNKGLEVIEAHWLFDTGFDKIEVVVHPQSIIHSMVEYIDGTVIAQLGTADMRTPILYALGYPERMERIAERLELTKVKSLTFEEPDFNTFRCLRLAYDAGIEGGTMPAVLNSANEVAVELFLKGLISFTDIQNIVENSMMNHKVIKNPVLEDILEADRITRDMVYNRIRMV